MLEGMERERDERSNKSSFFVLIVSFSSVLPIFSSFFLTLLPLRLPFACTVVSALVVHNSILFLTFPHFSFLGSGGAHVSCRQSLPLSLSLFFLLFLSLSLYHRPWRKSSEQLLPLPPLFLHHVGAMTGLEQQRAYCIVLLPSFVQHCTSGFIYYYFFFFSEHPLLSPIFSPHCFLLSADLLTTLSHGFLWSPY